MTLLPAILAMLGDKINAGRIFVQPHDRTRSSRRFWDRASRSHGRPVVWLVLAGGFMILLSLPYWLQGHPEDDGQGIKTGLAGIETLPDDAQSKQAFDAIVERFPEAGAQASVKIVVVGDGAVGAQAPSPARPVNSSPSWRRSTRSAHRSPMMQSSATRCRCR